MSLSSKLKFTAVLSTTLLAVLACTSGDPDRGTATATPLTPTSTGVPVPTPTATVEPPVQPTASSTTTLTPPPTGTPASLPTETPTPVRTTAFGFTDFPHEASIDGLLSAYEIIERDGNLVTMHFDDGVPWPEALSGSAYAQEYLAEVNGKASVIPPGHQVFLAITPIAFGRNGLAEYRGTSQNEPLPAPWNGRSFDHPDVVAAFIAHAERMIEIYSPDYFAYAVEANMLFDSRPELWDSFVALAEQTYAAIKSSHPELHVFVTLQAEWFHRDPTGQAIAIEQLLPSSDFIAVSTYPFIDEVPVDRIPADYFSVLANLAPEKPFAISETSWPAEDVGDPYPVAIPGSEQDQSAYVARVLSEADKLDAAFVTWFFTRDFDKQWTDFLNHSPLGATARIWKDTGLYDGDGRPRPALEIWQTALQGRQAQTRD